MLKKIKYFKILFMFILVVTLSACTGTKTMTNGEYKGELSFPFIGKPEGKGVFKNNNGEEFKGTFGENKFDGTLKNSDGTTFKGKITGDIFNEENKKQMSYKYEGSYTDGENNYIVKEMTIDVGDKKIINNFHFDGNLEEDGVKFTGSYDYNRKNKILVLNGKYEENENEYFDGKFEISNFEKDIVYNEKFGFIEDFEFENIIENYNLAFDGIIDYNDIYMDGAYSIEIENDIIKKFNFDGLTNEDEFTFEGNIKFNREKSEYTTDGISKEDDVIVHDGKLTIKNISSDIIDEFTLTKGVDELFDDDLDDSDFDFDGKMYDEGNVFIDGKYTYKSDSEIVTIDGKKYEKNTNNEYVLFLDGKFTLTENNLKGEGKVYNIYDSSLIESGNVDIDY